MAVQLAPLGLALFGAAALTGCYTSEGSGRVVVETFDERDFTEVALAGDGRLVVTAGEYRVSVSAEDDVLPSVRVRRKGPALLLGREVDWLDGVRPTVPVEFRVTLPATRAVRVSGSGEAVLGDVAGDSLRLAVSGSGHIRAGQVRVPELALDLSGAGSILVADARASKVAATITSSGNLSVAGATEDLALRISGAGLFRGSELRAAEAAVQVTGSGKALVWPERHLGARVTGAGSVSYRGEPELDASVQGAGRVARLNGDSIQKR